jgi:hypothetical protein
MHWPKLILSVTEDFRTRRSPSPSATLPDDPVSNIKITPRLQANRNVR